MRDVSAPLDFMEGRQWRERSVFLALVSCGSVLAGSLLFWFWHRRRRWSRTLPMSNPLQGDQSLRKYSLSHRIDIADTRGSCEKSLKSKTPQTLCVVGMDCEWVGEERGGKFPVALLQLAFLDGHCLLVRLCKIAELPSTLHTILQDSKILKFGVAIDNDVKRLQSGFGVRMAGCVDLQHLAVRCGLRRRGLGLRGLAASLLDVELDKSWRLSCSDWEANELSQQQIKYAATDAVVTLDILKALVHLKMDHKSPDRSSRAHSESLVDSKGCLEDGESLLSSETHSILLSLCQGVVDVAYKQPRNHHNTGAQQKFQLVQPKRQLHTSCIRQKPLYHNCHLLAPDGTLLSVVDRRKIQWYQQRGLGTLVSETPPTLQLNFEPAGKPGKDREYYMVQKENICVVCGSDKNCLCKNIVPQEYKKLFPAKLKDHMSHDVLLLCVSCHQLTSMHSDRFKARLAVEYGAPLTTGRNARFKQDSTAAQVRNFARALLSGHCIPESRRKELQAGVAAYCQCAPDNLTRSMIQEVAQTDTRVINDGFCSHAELVVQRVRDEAGTAGLLEFQKRWRQHFLDSMKPRFLPQLWSVNHNSYQH